MSEARGKGKKAANAGGGGMLTLTEVAKRTGISMPTLQRYKKEHQARIPSAGKGRSQRYPESALPVFEEIRKENIKKRGRPRKEGGGGGGGGRRKAAPKAAAGAGLLTLTEIGERTGISYPTLVRYVKLHGDQIPSEGEGRRRRYHPDAVEMFRKLRSQSGRGGRKRKAAGGAAAPAAGAPAAPKGDGRLAQRVASLERTQDRLEKQIRELIQLVRKPITVTVQRAK
jgi:DNA-binding transcriptional MerR regulator